MSARPHTPAWPIESGHRPRLRWGIVGTGSIASSMAAVIAEVPSAEAVAVVSRRLETAQGFAAKHAVARALDSCSELFAWDGVDAIYLAVPTARREELATAAAAAGKHVLVEKPFVSLASLERIVAACRAGGVAFMDATHFSHHPRTATIREVMPKELGRPWSLTSTFQFHLADRDNIRYLPELEPMGAIGDVGWYCMRAIVEYWPSTLEVRDVHSYLRRCPASGAVVSGCGVLRFADGSTSTWNCGYEAGGLCTDLRISGVQGVMTLNDFPRNDDDGSAAYTLHRGGFGTTTAETVRVPSAYAARAWMFEDFAAMIADQALRERSIDDSLRTQHLLDTVWQSALDNERGTQ